MVILDRTASVDNKWPLTEGLLYIYYGVNIPVATNRGITVYLLWIPAAYIVYFILNMVMYPAMMMML